VPNGFVALGWKDSRLFEVEILAATPHHHDGLFQAAEVLD